MAAKRVAEATKRRLNLAHQFAQAATDEIEQKIEQELAHNPQYRRLRKEQKQIKELLHRARVNLKRKAYGITVRQRRLQQIPLEIKEIQAKHKKVEKSERDLLKKQESLVAAMQAIQDQATRSLRDRGELPEQVPLLIPA